MQTIRRITIPLAVLVLCGLIAFLMTQRLLLSGGWFAANLRYDGLIRIPYMIEQFRLAFAAGYLYPRWLPDVYGGYGLPQFVFYQPGLFYFSLPFSFLFDAPEIAAGVSLMTVLALSFAGMYRLVMLLCGDRAWSIACVLLFAINLKVVWFVLRGVSPHIYAMCWAIWSLYFLMLFCQRLRDKQRAGKALAGYIACVSLTIISHPFVAVGLMIALPAVVIGRFVEYRFMVRLPVLVGLATLMAFVLTAGYWLPAMTMKDMIAYEAFLSISPLQLLQSPFSVMYFIFGAPVSQSSLYNFFMHAITLAGFYQVRRNPFYRGVFFSYFLLIFLQTRLSVVVWLHVPFLNFLQFPGRLNTILDILQLMAISQLLPLKDYITVRSYRAVYGASVAVIVVLFCAFYNPFNVASRYPLLQAMAWFFAVPKYEVVNYQDTKKMLDEEKFSSFSAYDELRPRTSAVAGLPNRHAQHIPIVVWEGDSSGYMLDIGTQQPWRIEAAATIPQLHGAQASLVINQLYFPGWVVRLNGVPLEPDGKTLTLDAHGRMVVHVFAAGEVKLECYYEGPPGWRMRNAWIAGLSLLLGGMVFMGLRKRY